MPKGGHLAAAAQSNSLVIADTAANVRRIKALISRIDRESMEDFEVLPLQHALYRRIKDAFNRQREAIDARTQARAARPGGGVEIFNGSAGRGPWRRRTPRPAS